MALQNRTFEEEIGLACDEMKRLATVRENKDLSNDNKVLVIQLYGYRDLNLDSNRKIEQQITSFRDGMSQENPWCVKTISRQ